MKRVSSIALLLLFCLLIPSFWQPQVYSGRFGQSQFGQGELFGLLGIAAYVVVALAGLYVAWRYFVPYFLENVSEKQALYLFIATMLVLTATVLIVYPIADNGGATGGSDGDDASDIAALALLRGDYPYYEYTYQDNPIARLPGAIFLAIPFVLLGASAYQNLFWTAAFFFVAANFLKSRKLALLLIWMMYLFSLEEMQQLVTGSGRPSNAFYVLSTSLGLLWILQKDEAPQWQKIGLALLFGVCLSSRSTYVVVVPLMFGFLIPRIGWQKAVGYLAISGVSLIAVTSPFLLYDPAAFMETVSTQTRKIAGFDDIVPNAVVWIAVANILMALLLAVLPSRRTEVGFLRNCAIALAIPIVAMAALDTYAYGYPSFRFAAYGVLYAPFGMLVLWAMLFADQLPHLRLASE